MKVKKALRSGGFWGLIIKVLQAIGALKDKEEDTQ